MKKYIFVLLNALLTFSVTNAQSVSDTIHVEHYGIYIDSINYTAKTIKASATLRIKSRMNNVNNIRLSLLKFTVDSIVSGNNTLLYSYNDTLLDIISPTILNNNDTLNLRVYYHGAPQKDASGWGGIYYSGNYFFNLGVGFDANPHNYGRAWYPCIDEFTDRSLYDFYITTISTRKAFCNGVLAGNTVNANGTITWHWQMNQTVPSYLVGIAVAPYHTLQRTSNGIPVEWACAVSDTANVLGTFQHLDTILSAFINAYGAYPFDKVGYSLVPFSSGAMEHATNIHIGNGYINGGLTYETLWAHELSHMWWGDKVTCESAGDMWLNEGFASFNEAYMTEAVYGLTAYKNWIRSNHRKVLQFAHVTDGSYLSFANVPHAYTYGTTVYQKGADAIHTLRNYMGDTSFFNGCKHYMNTHAFGNANSYDLRDDLTASSGINMNRFFDDWIFTPGFPHFSIDSVVYMPGGLDHYFVYVRQRSKGNNHLYSMPVEINFTNGLTDTVVTVQIDSATQMFHVPLYFLADMVTLDRNEKISDAITDYERWITSTGSFTFPETNATINVQTTGTDSSLVRIEHNWVAPDGWKQSNPGIRLSDYHYYRIDGLFKNGFRTKATFSYNGSTNQSTGHLDNTLITTREDSLVLLYREKVADDWQTVNGYTLNTGASVLDKVGSITVDTLKKGEYAFAVRDYTVSLSTAVPDQFQLHANPNPSNGIFHISFNLPEQSKGLLMITDSSGRIIEKIKLRNGQQSFDWNAAGFVSGIYMVKLIVNSHYSRQLQVVLEK